MKRFLLLSINVALAGSLALADVPESPPDAAEQARQLHRNRELVKMLVDHSVDLAGAEDPIRRAEYCNKVAESFASAIKQAADERDGERACELGLHFRDVLRDGVASNLVAVGIPPDSPGRADLLKISNAVIELTDPLELRLRRALDAEHQPQLERALRSVQDGRAGVEAALKNRGSK